MTIQTKLVAAFGICALLAGRATAALLDDFTGTPGSNPSSAIWSERSEPSGVSIALATDTGDLFQQGTSNTYVELADTSGSNGLGLGSDLDDGTGNTPVGNLNNQVATVSFLLVDPIEGQSQFVVRIANNTTGSTVSIDLRIGDNGVSDGGNGSAVLEDVDVMNVGELYEINLITNDTNSTLVDYLGTNDVGSGKYDVWVTNTGGNSTLVVDEGSFDNGFTASTNQSMDLLRFVMFSGSQGTYYIDDVNIDDGAQVGFIIPEPASLALLVSGTVLVASRRRR